MPNSEGSSEKKEKNKKTSSQDTQHQQTSNKNLEDFIEDEEENFDDQDFEENNSSGVGGINESEATALLTNLIAGNIPEENRQEFLDTYPVRVETLMKFVGFEELTEGANVKELPDWVRIGILVVGVGGLTFATVKKYQPEQNYEQEKEQKDNEEGWKG